MCFGWFARLFSLFRPSVAHGADYLLLRIDGLILKWDAPSLGEGAEVSYGFADARETFADAVNCGEMAPMATMAAAWGDDDARLERLTTEAFAMWSGAADIEFRRAAAGERPDILIGAQGRPQRIAFANVWHDADAAVDGVAPLSRATICFNPDVAWTIEGRAPRAGSQDLRTALAHEIGHAIGLDHPGATGALMGFEDQGPQTGLKPGDVAGAVALYGARPWAQAKRHDRRGGGVVRRGDQRSRRAWPAMPDSTPCCWS